MLAFNEERHEYSDGERVIPHVTGLLDKYGLTDYNSVPPHILEPGRILGSVVHRVTELHDNKRINYSTVAPEALPYLSAWINFLKVSGFQILHIEPRLYSKAYGFAGSPDRIGILKNWLIVLDIKTTKDCHRAVGPQTAAYKILARECLDLRIQKRYGLILKENGTFEPHCCNKADDEAAFMACLTLERWGRNGRR